MSDNENQHREESPTNVTKTKYKHSNNVISIVNNVVIGIEGKSIYVFFV